MKYLVKKESYVTYKVPYKVPFETKYNLNRQQDQTD